MVQKLIAKAGESFAVKKNNGNELNLVVPEDHVLLMLPAKRNGKELDVELGEDTFTLKLSS